MSHRVCVFCGSHRGSSPEFTAAAERLGSALVDGGYGLVYGGASVGLMGVLADSVLASGGEAIGVIPSFMVERELAHPGLSELHVVASMHERKQLMGELGDGFVAMPGGGGTLEELFEVFTWRQIGLHDKPIGLLDINGYFESLLAFLDRAVSEGFIGAEHRQMLCRAGNPRDLLAEMFGGVR